MEEIKDRFSAKAIAAGLEIKELIKEHGDKKIGEFFLPITTRAMSEIGMNFEYPFNITIIWMIIWICIDSILNHTIVYWISSDI
jgi:hypothetical protein